MCKCDDKVRPCYHVQKNVKHAINGKFKMQVNSPYFFPTKWLASFPFFSDNFFFFKYLFHTLQGSFASAFNNTCVNVLWHIGIMIIFLHYLVNRKKDQHMHLTQMECWTALKTHQTNKSLLQSKAVIVKQYFILFIQQTY